MSDTLTTRDILASMGYPTGPNPEQDSLLSSATILASLTTNMPSKRLSGARRQKWWTCS